MAVKMRLMRMGKKKTPSYRVVVVDGRSPRDGRYIEQIGRYDPQQDPSLVEIDNEKATSWLSKGAQPTEAVEKLLNISGAMNTLKVRTGQIHTVGLKPSAGAATAVAAADENQVVEPVEATPGPSGPGVAEEPAAEEIVADTATEEE
jgi:small subunit ribosomal protein S16